MATIVLSLGGSLIAPKNIDTIYLKKFRQLILNYIKKGNRAIIVAGGGMTARNYMQAAKSITTTTHTDLDWIGIKATKLNAELIRAMFGKLAHNEVIDNPEYKAKTNKKIIVGAGYLPRSSSDKDAVLLAKAYKADTVINLTNISHVYNKDPKKHKNAKPIKSMTWKQMRKIVGHRWIPGKNAPFDPIASKLAAKLGLRVVIANGKNLNNLKKILDEKNFKGTVIE
jgi:uridylate kinase